MELYNYIGLLIRAYKFKRKAEKEEINFTLKILKKGDFVIDIGAHKAAFAFWLSKAIGKKGKIFLFEPQPDLYKYLLKVTSFLYPKDITVFPLALSNNNCVKPLHFYGNHLGCASLEIKVDQLKNPIDVKVTTLDKVMKDFINAPKVAFIKCDVESHELLVLKGAEKLIKKDKPTLLIESSSLKADSTTRNELFNYLNDINYIGHFFFGDAIIPIKDYSKNNHHLPNKTNQNFIFFPSQNENRNIHKGENF